MDTVVLSRDEYEDIIDALDHAVAMRQVATGAMETLNDAEMDAYLAAATPLAFWRAHRGLSQVALAQAAAMSVAALGEMEAGSSAGTVVDLAKVARALRVRMEDLVVEP